MSLRQARENYIRMLMLYSFQVEDEKEEGKPGFVILKCVVWHKSFWTLLATIAHWAKLGHSFKCGDDVVRTLFPIILLLVSDYEEQYVLNSDLIFLITKLLLGQ